MLESSFTSSSSLFYTGFSSDYAFVVVLVVSSSLAPDWLLPSVFDYSTDEADDWELISYSSVGVSVSESFSSTGYSFYTGAIGSRG